MERLKRFLPKLQIKAEEWLTLLSAGIIGAMMLITLADVVARRGFRYHVKGSYEYVALLFVYIVFFGLAYAQRQDAHITIGVVYNRLPRKARRYVEGLTLGISFILFATLTWYTATSAWLNFILGDTVLGAIQVVTAPARVGVPVGLGLLALRLLVQIVRLVRRGELFEEVVVREDTGAET